MTRQITKHNFLVMDVKDIPRIVKEAFYLARTGRPGGGLPSLRSPLRRPCHLDAGVPSPAVRCLLPAAQPASQVVRRAQPPRRSRPARSTSPSSLPGQPPGLHCCLPLTPPGCPFHSRHRLAGPVLVDIPKDVQQTLDVPDWDAPMSITAYMSRLPGPPQQAQLEVRAPGVLLAGACLSICVHSRARKLWGACLCRRCISAVTSLLLTLKAVLGAGAAVLACVCLWAAGNASFSPHGSGG